jgi:hypothetical protein
MNINAQDGFLSFSQNTKYVCGILSTAIFLIFIVLIAPINLGKTSSFFGKLLITGILSYALYKNFSETHNYLKNIEGIFDNPKLSGFRNNMLLSHLLSLTMFILALYVLITIFV